ncbi:hypothetical protein P280DRAFT_402160 [Massarina eburnea CBS 473.64]|uniref:Small secreted protein n=1 Tax=Massarina eburnea CBS 473.64 TaxID=1395130 RepID=A0A6A6RWS7_9PLEO|nr:hypothetical protein P280DRAFT_402160 [Massarina eburnea CBS 473.64]
MRFSASIILSGLLASGAVAAPVATQKRAAVLSKQSYSQFQVSSTAAGNAQAEVMKAFPIDMNDLANVDPADQKVISDARQVAESAEVDTGGFNEQIKADSSNDALAVGKTKNKVLKLQLEVMDLMISQAQGKDEADKITAEQKKLDTNIAADKKNAGKTSADVTKTFTG